MRIRDIAGPDGCGMTDATGEANKALRVAFDRRRDDGGHRDDPAALPDLQVGRVQPQVGPLALQRPLQEAGDALVDVLAELRDRALREAPSS